MQICFSNTNCPQLFHQVWLEHTMQISGNVAEMTPMHLPLHTLKNHGHISKLIKSLLLRCNLFVTGV